MLKNIRLVTLCLCLTPAISVAVKVPGLYEIEVPVADQLEESRRAAIVTALRMVLVKLTGDRYAPGRKSLSPVLERADRFVQQYRYKEVPGGHTETDNDAHLLLKVHFDESALDKTLRDLGVPVWGRERPTTLVWLAVQDGVSRNLVSLDSDTDYISIVDDRAQLRGIVPIYPLLDLEDTTRLRPSDIWGGFLQPVLDASGRYRADSILIGSIESPVAGIWEGRWTAYINQQRISWQVEADLPDVVLDEGVDGMADILASQFVRSSVFTELASVEISVADIYNFDQYSRTLKYLESLSSVTDIQVNKVETGKVTFQVTAHGGSLAISQAIALGRILQSIGEQQGVAYRLLP